MHGALIEQAEHDVDRHDSGQDQPGLASERRGELLGVAGIFALDVVGHADVKLRRLDLGDGVAERRALGQIEAEGHGWKLLVVANDQRCGRESRRREGIERHLRVAGTGNIELVERFRVRLILRRRLQDDAVLVGLAVDRRDLTLSKGIIQSIADGLHRYAEPRGGLAIDIDEDAPAAHLDFGGDIDELRALLQALGELLRPVDHRVRIRTRQGVLIGCAAGPGADRNVAHALEGDVDARHTGDFAAHPIDDLIGGGIALVARFEHEAEIARIQR